MSADLGSVLLGGLLAIIAGGAAQYAAHHFATKREDKKLLREKAEKLCEAIHSLGNWVKRYAAQGFNEGKVLDEANPIDFVSALQQLYFPDIRKEIDDLHEATGQCIQTAGEWSSKLLELNHEAKNAHLRGDIDAFRKAGADRLEAYSHASAEFREKVELLFATQVAVVVKVTGIVREM